MREARGEKRKRRGERREEGRETRGERREERRGESKIPDLSFLVGVARWVFLSLSCTCQVSAFGFVDPISGFLC